MLGYAVSQCVFVFKQLTILFALLGINSAALVMTDFSSPQKLCLVFMPQNRHQRVTSTLTRLLVHQAWCLAIPTIANHAAQTELASRLKSCSQTDYESGNETSMGHAWEAREILWVAAAACMFDMGYLHVSVIIGTWP